MWKHGIKTWVWLILSIWHNLESPEERCEELPRSEIVTTILGKLEPRALALGRHGHKGLDSKVWVRATSYRHQPIGHVVTYCKAMHVTMHKWDGLTLMNVTMHKWGGPSLLPRQTPRSADVIWNRAWMDFSKVQQACLLTSPMSRLRMMWPELGEFFRVPTLPHQGLQHQDLWVSLWVMSEVRQGLKNYRMWTLKKQRENRFQTGALFIDTVLPCVLPRQGSWMRSTSVTGSRVQDGCQGEERGWKVLLEGTQVQGVSSSGLAGDKSGKEGVPCTGRQCFYQKTYVIKWKSQCQVWDSFLWEVVGQWTFRDLLKAAQAMIITIW